MSTCECRHDDPLLAELCEQMLENGADPEIAHDMALDMFKDAVDNGYGESL
ncbi:hypothetical protein [Rhodococcus erythropolis]|uniref:hypothetical protein n=1 Tax=Rhodococcus erythropolis TaxID=1833 RepID=UPI002226ADC8|nr:hypothetical protein [Rhodococcus erythropolis]MCW2300714.1 hypothetical protein [Rhodococcus erythropolis]